MPGHVEKENKQWRPRGGGHNRPCVLYWLLCYITGAPVSLAV